VTDEKFGEKMSAKVTELVPLKLADMGLVTNATKVFGKGSVFIIKL
jgi:hypothetical protein